MLTTWRRKRENKLSLKQRIAKQWRDTRWWYKNTIKWPIIAFFEFLKRWISYAKPLRKAYDFDYTSIYKVEYWQIKRIRDCITEHHTHVNWERNIERMNLALKLLDHIIKDDCIADPVNPNDPPGNWIWRCTKYVNTRNLSRFTIPDLLDNCSDNLLELRKAGLYNVKLLHLYFVLREYFTAQWWE